MNLDGIGKQYGTDKSSLKHDYLKIYEQYFEPIKNKNIKLLEIGVYKGSSMRMWEDYFPNAELFAIDINVDTMLNSDRVSFHIANQENRKDLLSVITEIGSMDVIIDDGGHTMMQQQVSLGCLFPYVKPHGIYVIEDLHTSIIKPHKYNPVGNITTREVLVNFKNNKKLNSSLMYDSESKYIEDNTDSCNIIKARRSEICFMVKK